MVKLPIYFIHRLYSDYLYFASSNKSADDFHEKVTEALQLFENCMLDYSLRACVYNNTLNNAMPVRIQQAPCRMGLLCCYYVQGGIEEHRNTEGSILTCKCHSAAFEWCLM
jgi:hypothetical protein